MKKTLSILLFVLFATVFANAAAADSSSLISLRQRIIAGGQRENGYYFISYTDENENEYKITYQSDLGILHFGSLMENIPAAEGSFSVTMDYDIDSQRPRSPVFSVSYENAGSPVISITASAEAEMETYSFGDPLPVEIADADSSNAEAFGSSGDYREEFRAAGSGAVNAAMNGWNTLLERNACSLRKIGFLNCTETASDGQEIEPNDSKSTATPITPGSPLLGEIDDDYYSISLETGKCYRVTIDPYTQRYFSTDLLISLYPPNSDEYIDLTDGIRSSGVDYCDYFPEVSGVYYIRVWNYSAQGSSYTELPYAISVEEVLEPVPVEEIAVDPAVLTIPAGGLADLSVTFSPATASNKNVTWESADPTLATVDQNGRVRGIRQGETTITAISEDGAFHADCNVTVLFSDVTNPQKALYSAVYELAARGIVKGYGSYFDSDAACTRAQFVLFLWRFAGKPVPKSTSLPFLDNNVIKKMSKEYRDAISWGTEKGIIKGFTAGEKKGKFMPNDPCTRGQVAIFLWRYKGQPASGIKKLSFKDSDQIMNMAPDYKKAILWAFENKITTGYSDGTFKPRRNCTRGECVTFLYRML